MTLKIPARVQARIAEQLKNYQAIVSNARGKTTNEAGTGLIVADILSDVFGYKKVEEITAEQAVKGTYADFAVKVGDDIRFLVEVKGVTVELKEVHVTQAVNYAVHLDVDWVVLTNAARWQVYKVSSSKPINALLVLDVDICSGNLKAPEIFDFFGGLSREVFTPDSMSEIFKTKQAMSKYSIAALLMSDPAVAIIRRELRKLADGLYPDTDDVRTIIQLQVIRPELLEGDEAKTAARAVHRLARQSKPEKPEDEEPAEPTTIAQAIGKPIKPDPSTNS